MDKPPREVGSAWEEFTRDARHGQNIAYYESLTREDQPGRRLLGYGVLLQLADHKLVPAMTRTAAARIIETSWQDEEDAILLCKAIARGRLGAHAHQVRLRLTDPRHAVRREAALTAEVLGLNKETGLASGQVLVESLPFEQVVATLGREKGRAEQGAQIYLNLGCSACHTVSAEEPPKGPFLGGIATRYSRAELCESILKPGEKIAQGFETQWFLTRDDEEIEGFVVQEAGEEVEVRNIQGITSTLARKDIKERGIRESSMMPAGLADKLTPQELAGLLAYLESLKSK